jgi:hypothetical protein
MDSIPASRYDARMIYMLCRNRVEDFTAWKRVFDTHAGAHRDAGLTLRQVARGLDDPNDIYFTFEVASIDRAKAFISAPEAADAAKQTGVIEGDYRFVELVGSYGS